MNKLVRVSCLSVVGLAAAACSVFACSSSPNSAQDTADGGGGGGGGGGEGGSGTDGSAGDGSSTADGGGTGGASGSILLTQSRLGTNFNYGLNAAFRAAMAGTTTMGGAPPTVTTMGACSATVIPTPPDNDAGLPAARSGLNAGTITLGGSGMPTSALLMYGPFMGQPGLSGYAQVEGSTKIFTGGDTMTLSGAGGPDLPAFATQTLVAPTEVVITAPVCGGTCPDLDRTTDLVVTWTGASAGKVVVTFETIADAQVVILECSFDPAAGTGTVPAALLAKLDKAGDPNVSGAEIISDVNKVQFNVGGIPTTFTIQSTNIESTLTVSN